MKLCGGLVVGKCGNGPNLVILPAEMIVSHCNTAAHAARLLALQCGASDPENNLKALDLKQQANKAFERGSLAEAEQLYTQVHCPPSPFTSMYHVSGTIA
jgi:hypothetical protein